MKRTWQSHELNLTEDLPLSIEHGCLRLSLTTNPTFRVDTYVTSRSGVRRLVVFTGKDADKIIQCCCASKKEDIVRPVLRGAQRWR